MNPEKIKGNLNQWKGQLKQRWAKLTDDDFMLVEGRLDEFIGRIQQRYGIAKEEAERQWHEFFDQHKTDAPARAVR